MNQHPNCDFNFYRGHRSLWSAIEQTYAVGDDMQAQHAHMMAAHTELGHKGYVIMHLSQVAAREIATQDVCSTFRNPPPRLAECVTRVQLHAVTQVVGNQQDSR